MSDTAITETKRTGRPSLFTPELFQEICERLELGEPLEVICRDDHMPSARTVYDWMARDETLSAPFARGRRLGFDCIAAECMAIADDEVHDWVMTKKGPITNEVAIGRAKLQVETRLKLLAKWDPKRYGDTASTQTVNVGVAVNVLTEERRAELMDKKRRAIEARRKA